MNKKVDEIKNRIQTGNSLLFCGAGFSTGCINLVDSHPLTAKDLSKEICKLGGFEEDDDLMFSSDYLINKMPNKIPEMIEMLRSHYTVKQVSESTKIICSYNWRRIYTTNYDNSISFSCNQQKKYIECLTLDDNTNGHFKNHNNCIHINGNITKLNKDTLNNSFKLTRSSYISSSSFENSNWYYPFKKDLEICNAIIFIGYSLYDIEIEKILFNGNFKEKTFFITHSDISSKEQYTLEKYGYVLPIGLDFFSNKLDYFDQNKTISNTKHLLCLELYKSKDVVKKINDSQISNFFLYGDLDSSYIDHFITATPETPYLIMRNKIEEISSNLKNNHNVVIYSDFGNGKTIIHEFIRSILTIEGLNVYSIKIDDLKYFEKDIDNILNDNKKIILCIDGYSRFIEILDYLAEIKSENIVLFLTERSNNHQHFKDDLSAKFNFYEFNADLLSTDVEINKFIDIINNLGYWNNKIRWGLEKKKNYIKEDCKGQISNVLLDLFNSPQMISRTTDILKDLLNQESFKKTLFAICIIEILGYQCSDSLISNIAGNDEIYNPVFTNSPAFKEIFNSNRGKLYTKSSLFSLFLLNNIFSSTYIVEHLLEIVERYNKKRSDGSESKSIFKELIRFSFVQRILPDKMKKTSLVSFYQDLKVKVDWLAKDPHFWLQYGMSELMFNNFNTSQKYFDVAYELIKNREDQYTYDSSYIDTQQAKLYLLKSLEEQNGEIIYNYFQRAHTLLAHLKNDQYKYRQVLIYIDVYKKKFNLLSKARKNDFITACKYIVKQIESDQGSMNIITVDYIKNKCLSELKKINN